MRLPISAFFWELGRMVAKSIRTIRGLKVLKNKIRHSVPCGLLLSLSRVAALQNSMKRGSDDEDNADGGLIPSHQFPRPSTLNARALLQTRLVQKTSCAYAGKCLCQHRRRQWQPIPPIPPTQGSGRPGRICPGGRAK